MTDATTTVASIRARVRAFNAEREWDRYHCPRNLAMSVAVESGELLALFLWSADDGPQPPVASRNSQVAEEAADVAICLINLCEKMDIDLSAAIADKLRINAERYPIDKAKGRLEKYAELDEV